MRLTLAQFGFLLAFTLQAPTLWAANVPFTETFDGGVAGWTGANATQPLEAVASGGPDGSAFARRSFSFAASQDSDTPVLIRAHANQGASAGAFTGDWLADGVTRFTARVRHDAPQPLSFFARFASPFNFPGGFAASFVPVQPNVWTELSFDIDPANPQFVTFEGSDFETVFGNVGNVQLGVTVPAGLAGVDQTFRFDVDSATIVPEPATAAVLALGAALAGARRRPRRA